MCVCVLKCVCGGVHVCVCVYVCEELVHVAGVITYSNLCCLRELINAVKVVNTSCIELTTNYRQNMSVVQFY